MPATFGPQKFRNHATPTAPGPIVPHQDPQLTERLRRSEERFALAVRATRSALWEWDLEEGERYASPYWKELLGWELPDTPDWFEGFADLVHPDDRERVNDWVERFLAGDLETYRSELRLQHRDGHYVPVVAHVALSRTPDGEPARLAGALQDVTGEWRARGVASARYAVTKLLGKATSFQEIMSLALEALSEPTDWDFSCVRLLVPRTGRLEPTESWHRPGVDVGLWERVFRTRTIEPGQGIQGRVWAAGAPFWIARAEDEPTFPEEALQAGMRSACLQPIVIGGEVRGVIEFYSRFVRPREDEFLEMLASFEEQLDETAERLRAQHELRTAARKYEEIVERAALGVLQMRPDGRLVNANPALATLLGYDDPAHLLEKGRRFLGHFVEGDARAELLGSIYDNGAVTGFEARLRRWDNSILWASIDARGIRDETGRITRVDAFVTDVTTRKETEQLKADFVSLVTHQLRTPLTGIRWMLELAGDSEPGLEAEEHIRDARVSAERMLQLVNELLEVSRIEAGGVSNEPEAVDLFEVTARVAAELASASEAKSLTVELPEAVEAPPVVVDPEMLEQVIVNLLSNAIQYTPDGGSVTVSISAEEGAVTWAVTDTGIGIPASAREHLFEKFYRAGNAEDLRTDGTGLGLYIARAFVERSGGVLDFDSEEGVGSTFRFRLPRSSSKGSG